MELDFIAWLQQRSASSPSVSLSIGDDAAALRITPGCEAIVTTDMLMDGTDFLLHQHEPARIGRKSLAVNLSDLAAMGARPVAAFVSFALPKSGGGELPRRLLEGMFPLAAEFGCPIAGGDTNSWNGPLVISVTAIGEADVGRAWRRSGAKVGDEIVVTGRFGGSLRGRHFDFVPRLAEATRLREMMDVHAAIDVSDGLSLDLWRLTQASSCGAELQLESIPISDDGHAAAAEDGQPAIDHALGDGEDFELILALSPDDAARLIANPPFSTPLTRIGRFVAGDGLWSVTAAGRTRLVPRGWEHGGT